MRCFTWRPINFNFLIDRWSFRTHGLLAFYFSFRAWSQLVALPSAQGRGSRIDQLTLDEFRVKKGIVVNPFRIIFNWGEVWTRSEKSICVSTVHTSKLLLFLCYLYEKWKNFTFYFHENGFFLKNFFPRTWWRLLRSLNYKNNFLN